MLVATNRLIVSQGIISDEEWLTKRKKCGIINYKVEKQGKSSDKNKWVMNG